MFIRIHARGFAWAAVAILALHSMADAWKPTHHDLDVYIGANRTLRVGDSLYDYTNAGGYPFTYPPFAGLVMYPVGVAPKASMYLVWTVATLAAVIALASIIASVRLPALDCIPEQLRMPLIAGILIVSVPFVSNMRSGQISIFLVLLILIDALDKLPHRYRGIATGIAAAIKLTPLAFIPFLWWTGRRRAAVTALITAGICTAATFVLLPTDSMRYWLTKIWNTERIGDLAWSGNQSLNGVLLRLSLDGTLKILLLAGLSLIIVAAAYHRAARLAQAGDLFLATLVVGAMSIAVSPVSWKHHQFWLVFATFVLIGASRTLRFGWPALVLLFTLIPIQQWRDLSTDPTLSIVLGNIPAVLAIAIATFIPFRPAQKEATASPLKQRSRIAGGSQGKARMSHTGISG